MNLDKITKLTGGPIFETKISNTNNILVKVLLIIGSIKYFINSKSI